MSRFELINEQNRILDIIKLIHNEIESIEEQINTLLADGSIPNEVYILQIKKQTLLDLLNKIN